MPALVAVAVAGAGALLMVAGARATDGGDRVVALGLAHSAAMTGGAVALTLLLRRRLHLHLPVAATLVRSTVTALGAGAVGAMVAGALDTGGRAGAAVAVVVGAFVVAALSLVGQWLLRAPELRHALRGLRPAAAPGAEP
jgi:hypothetical protein